MERETRAQRYKSRKADSSLLECCARVVRNNKSIEAICWKEKSFNKFSEKNLKARRVGASELRLNEIRKFAANGKTFLSPPSPRQATPELEPSFSPIIT